MPTAQEIADHLCGLISELSPSYALDIVNQAREDLYTEREWGFLWSESLLRVPALISAGTVAVTKYSRNVTFSAAARAFLDVVGIDDVQVAGRQFKVSDFEQEYTLESYDTTTGIGVLDSMYLGSTNAIATFQVYKRYFYPPEYTKFDGSVVFDFARFEAIIDLKNGGQLWTNFSNSWLNERDSTRWAEGTPYAFIPHKEKAISADESIMLYELYPVPKDNVENIYKILYLRKGYNLKPNEKFPNVFSKSLLIAAAEISAYKWCAANRGKFPTLQKTNWENMIALSISKVNPKGYHTLLEAAMKRDEEIFPQALQASYTNYPMLDYGNSLGDFDSGYYGMNETLVTSDGVGRFRF